jgi:hypothetical protein
VVYRSSKFTAEAETLDYTSLTLTITKHFQIKYDTKITAKENGSIKMVRRDRTVIVVRDDGAVTYKPRTAWNESALKAFAEESVDSTPAVLPVPPTPNFAFSASEGGRHHTTPHNSVTFAATVENEPYASLVTSVSATSLGTNKKSAHGNASKASMRADSGSNVSVVETGSASSKVKDVFISTQALETKYAFNIFQLTCKIEVIVMMLMMMIRNDFK